MRNRSLVSSRNSCSHDSDPPSRKGAAWRPQRFPPSKNPARTLVGVVRRSVCFISGRDSSTPENLQVSSTTLPCLNQTGAGWCLTLGRARCKNGLPSWPDKTLVRTLLGGGASKCLICSKRQWQVGDAFWGGWRRGLKPPAERSGAEVLQRSPLVARPI